MFVGLVLVAGLTMAGLFALRRGQLVRLPAAVRARPAAVRPGLRRRRGLPDRRDPAQRAPAAHVRARHAAPGRAGRRLGRRAGARGRRRDRRGRPRRRARPDVRRCCSPSGWPCPTRPRWRWPATATPRARPRRCSARSSSAWVRWSSPLVGILGNDAVAMARRRRSCSRWRWCVASSARGVGRSAVRSRWRLTPSAPRRPTRRTPRRRVRRGRRPAFRPAPPRFRHQTPAWDS